MYFDTGSVMRSLPSSIIIMMATPVTGFVIDAMRKTASFVIGFFDSMSVDAVASRCAMRPLRATSVTPPEISPAAMRFDHLGDARETLGRKPHVFGLRRDQLGRPRQGQQRDEHHAQGYRHPRGTDAVFHTTASC